MVTAGLAMRLQMATDLLKQVQAALEALLQAGCQAVVQDTEGISNVKVRVGMTIAMPNGRGTSTLVFLAVA